MLVLRLLAATVAGWGLASCAGTQVRRAQTAPSVAPAARVLPRGAVVQRTLTFVDHSRLIRFPGERAEARRLVTIVLYPAQARGPLPLIVFGHGFAVTPAYYMRLLSAWARAGYVVAAPVFPLENRNAPGGPNESDLVHQPRDMSFVITSVLRASAAQRGPLSALISHREIAVSGQSDGGETALAVAYDRHFMDRRIRAAIILSGAEIPGGGGFDRRRSSPPLLASQGTADVTNQPRFTYAFFRAVRRPKYLLRLLNAGHLPPYTYEQPQLSIVERVTTAFLDRYLKGERSGIDRMILSGNVRRRSTLEARP